jgi:hypothetical protein
MLRLTPDQLTAALAGLNSAERIELLGLLEARERNEAERPVDTRPPLSSLFHEFAPGTAAQKSGDPDEYLRKHKAHEERRAVHATRLERQRPSPDDHPSLSELFAVFRAAGEAAEADGYPNPGRAPAPTPEEPELNTDMEDRGGRREGAARPLPAVIRDDVAQSRARDRAPRRPKPDEVEETDKLAPFRGIGPLDYFPHIDD